MQTEAQTQQTEQLPTETKPYRSVVRKFDSDDIMRLRSFRCIVDMEKSIVDNGGLQKTFICCGFTSLQPYFKDIVAERTGVTDAIFKRRWEEEFREIPYEVLDKLYLEVLEVNKFTAKVEDIQKK